MKKILSIILSLYLVNIPCVTFAAGSTRGLANSAFAYPNQFATWGIGLTKIDVNTKMPFHGAKLYENDSEIITIKPNTEYDVFAQIINSDTSKNHNVYVALYREILEDSSEGTVLSTSLVDINRINVVSSDGIIGVYKTPDISFIQNYDSGNRKSNIFAKLYIWDAFRTPKATYTKYYAILGETPTPTVPPSLVKNAYYVSTNGDDIRTAEEARNINTPWRTIQKAASTMVAGDTCYIRGGTYRETFIPTNSGTSASPISYLNYPGETVEISGAEVVNTQWQHHSGNIYKTNITLGLGDGNQVFVNNNMMMEARWPNTTSSASNNNWLLEGNLGLGTNGMEITDLRYSFADTNYDSIDPTGAKVWITPLLHHGWCNYTGTVDAYDLATKTITFNLGQPIDPQWDKCKVSYGNKNSNYYLFGKLDYLDAEKEYHYDSNGTLYLYQPGGGQPSSNTVEYKARQYGIDLSNKSYINIEGINLFGCSLKSTESSSNLVIDKLNAKYISHWSTADCNTTSRNNDTGIQLLGSYNEIRNSEIAYSAGNGIFVKGDNNKVVNNYIHDCNYLGIYTSNINLHGAKNVVSYNTLLRSGRSLLTGRLYDCRITHNELGYANIVSADGACIYLGFRDGGNTEISYNYAHNTGGKEKLGTGIYLDNYSHNYIIHHNYTDGLQLNGPRSHVVACNNTVFGSGLVRDYWIADVYPNDGMGTFLLNNIITPTNLMDMNRSINPIIASLNWDDIKNGDPKLNSDGSLKDDSPCIDYPGAIQIDYINDNATDGLTDLGAFEYGVVPWKYGHDFNDYPPDTQYYEIDIPIMNRVKNGSFTTGNLDGWKANTNRATNSYNRQSYYSFSAETKSGTSIEQTLTGLKPNSTYTLTAWSRTGLNGQAVLGVKDYGGSEVFINGSYDASLSWELNTLTFQTGATNTTATIYLKNTGSGLVYWDDVGVYLNLENVTNNIPLADPSELVYNGRFVGGTSGWYGIAGAVPVIDTNYYKSSPTSIKVTNRTSGYSSIAQNNIRVENNKKYKISAWLKLDGVPLNFNCRFYLSTTLAGGSKVNRYTPYQSITNNEWNYISLDYLFNETVAITNLQISLETGSSLNNFYLDDVSVKPLSQ